MEGDGLNVVRKERGKKERREGRSNTKSCTITKELLNCISCHLLLFFLLDNDNTSLLYFILIEMKVRALFGGCQPFVIEV